MLKKVDNNVKELKNLLLGYEKMNVLGEKIQDFLESTLLIGAIERDTNLIDSGIVDSMQILELSAFIEETCDIILDPDDMQVENFTSIDTIVAFVSNKRELFS